MVRGNDGGELVRLNERSMKSGTVFDPLFLPGLRVILDTPSLVSVTKSSSVCPRQLVRLEPEGCLNFGTALDPLFSQGWKFILGTPTLVAFTKFSPARRSFLCP